MLSFGHFPILKTKVSDIFQPSKCVEQTPFDQLKTLCVGQCTVPPLPRTKYVAILPLSSYYFHTDWKFLWIQLSPLKQETSKGGLFSALLARFRCSGKLFDSGGNFQLFSFGKVLLKWRNVVVVADRQTDDGS